MDEVTAWLGELWAAHSHGIGKLLMLALGFYVVVTVIGGGKK